MFQLGPKWFLAEAEHVFKNDIHNIHLRGYAQNELEIPVPAEFSHLSKFPSVDDIAFQFCPTRRDFYLYRIRKKKGKTTWGRVAGPLIEKYCKGLIDKFCLEIANNYAEISACIDKYSAGYEINHQAEFNSLAHHVTTPEESIGRFQHYLRYAGKFELSMLETDRNLGKKTSETKKHEFLKNFPIQYQDDEITIKPNSRLIGISSPAKPDFLIPSFSIVGDVKSGKKFEDYYRLTCAGYALAYESQHGENNDINFGVIYFLGTHTLNFSTAQTYLFLIDDELRREFLDKRNETLKILATNPVKAPDFVEREKYCILCKYIDDCDADRTQEKNQSPST